MSREPASSPRRSGRRLLIIFGVVVILTALSLTALSVCVHRMEASYTLRSNEAVLRQDLRSLRDCIDQYTQDKMKAPQDLSDLVSAGYLRVLPKDPFTHASDTWQVSVDQTQPGISDIHSGSTLTSSEGTAYSTW